VADFFESAKLGGGLYTHGVLLGSTLLVTKLSWNLDKLADDVILFVVEAGNCCIIIIHLIAGLKC
ncbi:hypothetical protein MKW92_033004, partial [Papaver armeniacum]